MNEAASKNKMAYFLSLKTGFRWWYWIYVKVFPELKDSRFTVRILKKVFCTTYKCKRFFCVVCHTKCSGINRYKNILHSYTNFAFKFFCNVESLWNYTYYHCSLSDWLWYFIKTLKAFKYKKISLT